MKTLKAILNWTAETALLTFDFCMTVALLSWICSDE